MKIPKFPNTLVIMIGFILFVSLLTFIIPQGQYDRVINPETQTETIVPGSYHTVDAESISILDIIKSIPEGLIGRADLAALILLIAYASCTACRSSTTPLGCYAACVWSAGWASPCRRRRCGWLSWHWLRGSSIGYRDRGCAMS